MVIMKTQVSNLNLLDSCSSLNPIQSHQSSSVAKGHKQIRRVHLFNPNPSTLSNLLVGKNPSFLDVSLKTKPT